MIKNKSNPLLSEKIILKSKLNYSKNHMTVEGTVNKSILLLTLLVITALITWSYVFRAEISPFLPVLIISSSILGLIFALITIFKQNTAMYTAPIYAVIQGVFLASISTLFELTFPGIVMQAILLTFGVFFIMLYLFKSKIIRVTEKFKAVMVSAIGGIFIIYLLSFILSLFGVGISNVLFGSGIIGIGFGLFVVVIAALTLILDFDRIVKASKEKLPQHFEWYCAFSLMVTLIWLYLEILRLLARLRSRH